MKPVRNQVYTLRDVLLELHLRDSPFLNVFIEDERDVIQTSHVMDEELLSIDDFAATKWRYLYETEEWIPLFQYVGDDIEKYIDVEPRINMDGEPDIGYWVTPKGFPRKQYLREDNNHNFLD